MQLDHECVDDHEADDQGEDAKYPERGSGAATEACRAHRCGAVADELLLLEEVDQLFAIARGPLVLIGWSWRSVDVGGRGHGLAPQMTWTAVRKESMP